MWNFLSYFHTWRKFYFMPELRKVIYLNNIGNNWWYNYFIFQICLPDKVENIEVPIRQYLQELDNCYDCKHKLLPLLDSGLILSHEKQLIISKILCDKMIYLWGDKYFFINSIIYFQLRKFRIAMILIYINKLSTIMPFIQLYYINCYMYNFVTF